MLINSENIIDLDCFTINPSISIQEIDLGCTKVYTMDNFYEKFEHAHEEMLKLPFSPVHKSDNITHFDGRSSYAYSMTMTECPLTTHYKHLVAQLAEVSVERVECKDRILFNAFQFTTEWFDYQNNWYNIHNDASYSDSSNMISMVVFMNKHYEEGKESMSMTIRTETSMSSWNQKKIFHLFLPYSLNQTVLSYSMDTCLMVHV